MLIGILPFSKCQAFARMWMTTVLQPNVYHWSLIISHHDGKSGEYAMELSQLTSADVSYVAEAVILECIAIA